VLAKAGKPYARLVPLAPAAALRQPGQLAGRVDDAFFRATERGRTRRLGALLMRLLLDTHVLLWWWTDDARLSRRACRPLPMSRMR
jgi:hypothetical protein